MTSAAALADRDRSKVAMLPSSGSKATLLSRAGGTEGRS